MKKKIYSIEGLRALSFLAITVYHLYPHRFTGGFLGVVIFFSITGFFITLPYARNKEKQLPQYFRSRFLKIIPPLAFLLVLLGLWTFFLQPQVYSDSKKYILSSLFGINNYVQLFSGFSYFDLHGSYNLYVHLWALAVEIQFYLLFPFVLRRLEKEKKERKLLALLGITLFSTLYMAILYLVKGPGFAYYSSLARLLSFSTASLFAYLFIGKIHRERWSFPAKPLLQFVLFIFLFVFMFLVKGDSGILYLGGMLFYSICASYLLVLLCQDEEPLTRFLKNPVLQFIGKRAYSLYLWQYAIMVLFANKFAHSTFPYGIQVILQLILVFILAEVSYRIFEKRRFPILIPIVLLFAILLPILLPVPPNLEEENLKEKLLQQAAYLESQRHKNLERIKKETVQGYMQIADIRQKLGLEIPSIILVPEEEARFKYLKENNAAYPELAVSLIDYDRYHKTQGIAIGDSVMVAGGLKLQDILPNFVFDASISRQFFEAADTLSSLLLKKPEAELVVIGLGSNGIIPLEKDVERLLKIAGKRKIFLINTIVPNSYEQDINQLLYNYAEQHPNVQLIDWYGRAKNRPELFYDDNTHPNADGADYYAQFLLKTLIDEWKK